MLRAHRERGMHRRIGAQLGAGLSARAREPVFFLHCGVPDTIDGRFDVLMLHAWLVLERLQSHGEDDLAQALVDALFVHLEEALREQGAGDMSMSRRLKKMAGAFYGRLQAYRDATDENALAAAVTRNLYRGDASRVEQAVGIARYAVAARTRLAQCCLEQGQLEFGPLPAPVEAIA